MAHTRPNCTSHPHTTLPFEPNYENTFVRSSFPRPIPMLDDRYDHRVRTVPRAPGASWHCHSSRVPQERSYWDIVMRDDGRMVGWPCMPGREDVGGVKWGERRVSQETKRQY